jgi:hypothetical protein
LSEFAYEIFRIGGPGKGRPFEDFSIKGKSHEYDLQAVLREFGDSFRRWRWGEAEVGSNANRRIHVRDRPESKAGTHAG